MTETLADRQRNKAKELRARAVNIAGFMPLQMTMQPGAPNWLEHEKQKLLEAADMLERSANA